MPITRRQLGLAAAALITVPIAGCTSDSKSDGSGTQQPTQEKRSARGFVEPPFLADRVKAGSLPPIDERLPDDCFVVDAGTLEDSQFDSWQVGRYGGTIRSAATSATGTLNVSSGATMLRSPSQTISASRPNVASEWSHSDDLMTFRFTIRPGLRWSDGTKVTTEDVRFLFEDLYNYPDANFPFPTELYTQRNQDLDPAKLKVIDKQTFELKFSKPYGMFLPTLNSWIPGYTLLIRPAHYLKQFHAKYASKAKLAAELKKSHYKTWSQLLTAKNLDHWSAGEADALGMPVLNAWVLAKADEQQRTFERNPYFWHVDKSGHQLPYADSVVNQIVVDTDALTAAIMDGQLTIASGDAVTLNKMPVYKQSTQHADTRVILTRSFNYPSCLFFNHDYRYDHPGDPWQALVADPEHRFGKAIAAAMDPDEVNKSVYFGLMGKPILNNTNHDPGLAKNLLNQLGMDKMDGDGFRLAPDGTPFTLAITYAANLAPDFAPVAELLKSQIGAVGIRVTIKGIDDSLFSQRAQSNQIMASLHWNDGPNWATGISNDYMPADKGPWSPATWEYVQSKGKSGRKPPAYIQHFYDLNSARSQYIPSEPDGQKAFQQLLNWLADNYALIPTTGSRVKPNIVKNNVHNVAKQGAPCELDMMINLEGVWLDA